MVNIKVFDVLQNDYWKQRVLDSIVEIVNSGHRHSNNYSDLKQRLHSYDCFTVVVDIKQDKLLAISGLYNGNIYPPHTARILDRTYYYDWKDPLISGFNSDTKYNTNFAIPFQEKVAYEKGYNSVFISVQDTKRRRALKRLSALNSYELLPNLYNTCRKIPFNNAINNDTPCWQNVAIKYLSIKHMNIGLPSITIEEYNERY
jgi:hypothetical protein